MTPDVIRSVVERPDEIVENFDQGSLNYFVKTGRNRFRMVAVKRHQNRSPEWEVATAYATSSPPYGNMRTVWKRT